jgi:flavin-dependent dehydrogenase
MRGTFRHRLITPMAMTEFDTIVVGAGPAGCTASTVLAQKGRRVLLLEKEKMPRYHIGESLMPYCWFTLERLGVLDQMKSREFVQKLSVQFVSQDGGQSRPFYFFQHNDHPASYTWQVERAEFDQMLYDNAKKHGVDARDETKVTQFLQDATGRVIGVTVSEKDGTKRDIHAPFTVDCTGRDAVWSRRQGWSHRDPKLNKIAIWTYFKGAKRDPGLDAGSTTVGYIPNKGWFWYIPLKNDVTSVGIVAERDYLYRDTRDPAAIMQREIVENTWIKEHLAPGQQFGQHWVTGEFSYRAQHCATDGLVMAGDAFAFLDPVFSSGVFLALKSGEMAADAIDAALTAGNITASAFDHYGTTLCSHIETMRKIVYAFYDPNFSFGGLIKQSPQVRGRLTDCLIGDVKQNFDELFRCIADLAALPPELDYGQTGKPATPKLPAAA